MRDSRRAGLRFRGRIQSTEKHLVMKLTPVIFFRTYSKFAQASQIEGGVPASISLAQAALESSWGGSGLSSQGNNFFGIKDSATDEWYGQHVDMDTTEYNPAGQAYTIKAGFRKYASPQGSFDDHVFFLQKNKRYKSLFKLPATDYKGWANGLEAAGYATDPNYAEKLISMVEKYGLAMYDRQAELKKKS